uniref:BHLH domain-containing protein n=1 Tax=Seriola dumerili TaxID=41447 RepID=A0A3B4UST6_SERDU
MSVQLRLQPLYKKLSLCSVVCRCFPASSGVSASRPLQVLIRCRWVFSCEAHCPPGDMTAGSPVPSPDSSRNKSQAAEDPQVPVLLLRDMNLCYRLLRQLVPGVPPGRAASRVDILQHVIDYILDLQTELDASCPPEILISFQSKSLQCDLIYSDFFGFILC